MSDTGSIAVSLPSSSTVPHSDPIMPSPLFRDSVEREHAELTRIIGRGLHARVSALGEDALLSLHLPEPKSHEQATWDKAIAIAGAAGPLEIAQGTRLLRGLSGIDLGAEGSTSANRWEWLEAALVGRLTGTPFGFVQRVLREAPSDTSSSLMLRLTLRTESHVIMTHARAGVAAWRNMLAHSVWEQGLLPISCCLDLPFNVAISLARHSLPTSVLRTLSCGDLILPVSPRFTSAGDGWIRAGGRCMQVRYQAPCLLKIISAEETMEATELEKLEKDAQKPVDDAGKSTAPGHNMPPEDLSGLDDMPIMLDFELGQVRMTLREMRALGTGAILALEDGSPASIIIRAGGRMLGRGEAVGVNGNLGIRIIAWKASQ